MKYLIILCFAILLITSVSAARTEDVVYKIRIIFEPECTTSCTNSTTGNLTTQTCTENCWGRIRLIGEEENHLTVIESLSDLQSGGKVYTGYKTTELGNDTDITTLVSELQHWKEYEKKFNDCLDSNRNFSSEMILLQDDVGYKSNYTECVDQKKDVQSKLNTKTSLLTTKEEEIKENQRDRFLWGIGGAIIGALFFTKFLPWSRGKNSPGDESEKQFAPNAGYN